MKYRECFPDGVASYGNAVEECLGGMVFFRTSNRSTRSLLYMLLSLRVACQQRQCATDSVYNAKKEVAAIESDVCCEELH